MLPETVETSSWLSHLERRHRACVVTVQWIRRPGINLASNLRPMADSGLSWERYMFIGAREGGSRGGWKFVINIRAKL